MARRSRSPRTRASSKPTSARRSSWREPPSRVRMLELKNVTAGYGHFTALWDVSLRVDAGEAVAVVGPNGAGKTTLMRVISVLIAPRAGEIVFDGTPIGGRPAYDIV